MDCITKYGQINNEHGPTIHGLDKPRTLLFTDLTNHGPLLKLQAPLMIDEKLGVISKSE